MIDSKTIEHVARLAKLQMSAQEAQMYSEQLSKALIYFQQISKVDTQNIEPLVTPSQMEAFWRPDEPQKELNAEELVANSPEKLGNLFKVPPVV